MAKKTGVELEFSILDDDFKKAIKEMNSSISSMKKELNLENEVLKSSNASIIDYQNKLNNLKQQQEISKNKIQEATAAYEKAKEMFGENSKEASKYKDILITAQTEQQKITNDIEKTTKSLEEHESALKDDEQKNRELNSTLGSLTSTINEQKGHLEDLKRQYVNTVLEQGKGSNQAKTLKEEIKNLSSEIKSSENRLDNAESELREFAEEEDNAGKSTLSLGEFIKGNLISEGIIAGVKNLVNIMKSVGSTLIDVCKTSIQSYADYEQLIGGVETLFKDSADIVSNYANNAYKTSGLSANKYMETVTSFSASLLQSLDGDTKKAAEIADMAIVDMSDNANKMGTDMSMIQSAYQGFAKQNYTMLDNLKLGYGGTKTEMERLLADAKKITGIKYNINNLNDVYQAIHVIQGELGITGTTAKEASSTISGSLSSMKSAWSNLLIGVADENSNFNDLVNNFVNSVVIAGQNLIPRIEVAIEGVGLLITDMLGLLISNILPMGVELVQNLISGISESLPDIISSINNLISVITNGIISMLPQLLQMGIQIIISLAQGIAEQLPILIPQMINAVISMVDTLLDNIDLIIDAGIQLILGLADGLINALPDLIDKIPVIIDKLIIAITDNLPKLIEAGITLTVKIAEGLIKAIPQLVSKIPQIITSLIKGITNYFGKMNSIGSELLGKVKDGITNGISSMLDVGKNIVQGLWNGINNAKDWIIGKIKGFKDSVLNSIKSFFGIHSPSTVFRDEIGKNLALGVGLGFSDEMIDVAEEMQNSIPSNFDIGVNTNTLKTGYSNNIDDNFTRNISDTSDYDPGQVSPIYLTIENFYNNREQDIEDLSEELAFYGMKNSYGKGM